MKLKKKSRRGAFTLIEIMVAIAIFGMIVAAIYSTWVLILSRRRSGRKPPRKSSASASPCGRLKIRSRASSHFRRP